MGAVITYLVIVCIVGWFVSKRPAIATTVVIMLSIGFTAYIAGKH